ncbi:glycosyltransferase [Formosa haliotis]|uniref:glycosyltransferase n=1 Tax=Formosa haliotis TaxID=1555194 RepID=UPI00082618FD|nr:glycosyltransferase [Formosa haliotis]
MRIYYYIPYHDKPSWGIGIVMHHISILNENGFNASAIIRDEKTTYEWLDFDVPSITRKDFKSVKLEKQDVLVVPEVSVDFKSLKKLNCIKILFIQNLGYVFNNLPKNETHKSLGFDYVFSIMPHMSGVIEKYIDLPEVMIPPFILENFKVEETKMGFDHKKNKIVMFPKFDQIDYKIVYSLLNRRYGKKLNFFERKKWEIVELKGYTHKEVSDVFKESKFFIALNTFESLNASIVEAMASGCIVYTYEGYGSRDFIRDGENCFSFQNNEPYLLVEKLNQFIDQISTNGDLIYEMQKNARHTSESYSRSKTEYALVEFFNTLKR